MKNKNRYRDFLSAKWEFRRRDSCVRYSSVECVSVQLIATLLAEHLLEVNLRCTLLRKA